MLVENSPLVERTIGLAIEIHRALGPGLLESVYEACLGHQFQLHRIRFARQVPVAVEFKGLRLPCGYRVDFVVDETLIVELKSVEHLMPIHSAQTLTYLKLSGLPRALLINFNVELLKNGVKSFFNPLKIGDCPRPPISSQEAT